MRQATIALLVALLCGPPRPAVAEPPPIPALIEQLNAADFPTRESAARQLATYGMKAIDALVGAAQGDSPEVASRGVVLLERMMEGDDAAAIDAADAALVALAASDQPHAAALAAAALERHAPIREERAVAKIIELGGQVQYSQETDPLGRPLGMLPEADEPPLRPRTILLGRNWKGGTDGLKYLRRLAHYRDLILYVVQGSGVPLDEAQSLAGVLPGLVVHHRGPYLGVGTVTDGQTECIIGDVKPNGPADKAGLRQHDTVLALGDQEIRSFHELVDSLKQHDEGDTVTITVERFDREVMQNRVLDIKVELGTWELPRIADSPQSGMRFPPQMIPPPQFPRQPAPPPVPEKPEPR